MIDVHFMDLQRNQSNETGISKGGLEGVATWEDEHESEEAIALTSRANLRSC